MATYPTFGPQDTPMGDAGDTGFIRLNARLRPDQLQPGEVAVSENGRMGLDGAWQPRKGANVFSDALATGEEALTVPFYTYGDETISQFDIAVGSDIITFTKAGHPFVDQTLAYVAAISGVTGFTAGNYVITVIDASNFSISVPGVGGAASASTTVGAPIVNDDVVNQIYGSCLFSDPSDNNAEYIIIATNSKAIAIKVSDRTTTDIAYPAGVVLDDNVDMIQAFNYVFIFRDGLTSLEWDGDFTGSPAFALVANGAYTQPVYYNALNNTVIADGVATVSETAHGLTVGEPIYVINNGSSDLVVGQEYSVASVPSVDSFTVNAQVPDSAVGVVVWSKRVSVGLGFTHMPAPPWGIYHQRRLWMPFKYTTSGSSGTPTITSRDISDEIIVSDILDQDTYDQIYGQFRIASGGADYVVALQPFAQDNVVVFNRNTIHLITGASGDIQSMQVNEITREVGCIARRSIAQVGNQILFLSDNGVYSVDFGDLYNLRGASVPLSEPIQPYIDRINTDYIANSVAIYHDNRYYIAVPLDGSTENNALFVYNFLNQGWESVDTVGRDGWNIRNLIRAGAGGTNRLFAVNSIGGVHELEARLDDVDFIATQIGDAGEQVYIPSSLSTRAYNMGTIDRKRYNSFEIQAESTDTNVSNANFTLICENPDSETTLKTLAELNGDTLTEGEDVSLRGRCGNKRGYSGQLVITPTLGRPKIRAVRLTAQLVDMSITSKS